MACSAQCLLYRACMRRGMSKLAYWQIMRVRIFDAGGSAIARRGSAADRVLMAVRVARETRRQSPRVLVWLRYGFHVEIPQYSMSVTGAPERVVTYWHEALLGLSDQCFLVRRHDHYPPKVLNVVRRAV